MPAQTYASVSEDSAASGPETAPPEGYEQAWGNAAEGARIVPNSYLAVTRPALLQVLTDGEPSATTTGVDAGEIVREAVPGGGDDDPDHTLVATSFELFGWLEDDAIERIPAPENFGVTLDTADPDTRMPQLAPGDYDRLAFAEAETDVFLAARSDVLPFATVHRMEAFVVLETTVIGKRTWNRVKIVRDPPVIAWMPDATRAVDSAPEEPAQWTEDLEEGVVDSPAVLALEQQLDGMGYHVSTPDEHFGPFTTWAVEDFQRENGLTVDGQVGPMTRDALRDAHDAPDAETWTAGYRMRTVSNTRVFTPSGTQSEAGMTSAVQQRPAGMGPIDGEVEVLWAGGAPVTTEQDGLVYWFVRALDGGGTTGWVRADWVTADGAQGEGTSVRDEIAAMCPNGITVSFVAQHADPDRHFSTFLAEAGPFAAQSNAVALAGGQLVTGTSNLITQKDDIVAILARIQELLRGDEPTVPQWARVAHVGIFTHGSTQADRDDNNMGVLETDYADWNQEGNLRVRDLQGFASTLALFGTSDMRMSLFACSTGASPDEYQSSAQPEHAVTTAGDASPADRLADGMLAAGFSDPTVMGHTSVGPTVRNPDLRLFGGGDTAISPFPWAMLPLSPWLGEELDAARAMMVDPEERFERELWRWYKQSVIYDPEEGITVGNYRFTFLISTDPEMFRVAAQAEARKWVREQLPAWGVHMGGVELGSDVPIPARYRSVEEMPGIRPDIPPHAPLVVIGAPETWHADTTPDHVTPIEWTDEHGDTQRAWVSTRYIVPSPEKAEGGAPPG